ncbi:hypothetical protein C4577_03425 [Candidatus Parcubacteria bacterium]|nr:MAG: hypothetical protein C4577_03425 [Candidatus Parcubacteria bacterium]
MKIKILSWNIWRGKHLEDAIEYLRRQDADIIGLQEVIEKDAGGKRENLAEIIAGELGYNFFYCKAFTTDRHTPSYDIGNAVLSRYKIEASACHTLSDLEDYEGDSATEPRGVIEAHFKFGDKILKVFNTHLSYSFKLLPSRLRAKQIDRLVSLLGDTVSMILVGDFNAEVKGGGELEKINEKLILADNEEVLRPTWSVYPVNYKGFKVEGLKYRIDNIFVSKDIKVEMFNVEKSKASDHLPISAVIEV